ncbi:TM2 domain containing protein [Thermobacillus xylanilyticus]|jgi:TM2 domain.|uniref:TM2 domain containing protein n=1 Tax=Thermobacillus xylanilyticus TaxID=76633 RepID=A0ABN7RFT4_THEXY|nr:TM2 domain-containing protein [Thermobacillus xylanilyticus]REJ12444.1 MAG: TM2 domain-containing protein [Paenibacillaceae bacterium]CAG5076213.1 TM2 domain containing protein [Thermobacillus xylanilyticus]
MNKRDLTLEQLLVLQSEMRHAEKSLALAYFMLLGGHLGVHRFYLKRYVSGTIQLILFLAAAFSYFTAAAFSGVDEEWNAPAIIFLVIMLLTGLALFIWIIVDLFIMPRMVREWNEAREAEIIRKLTGPRQS